MRKNAQIVAARGGNISKTDEKPDGLDEMILSIISKNPIERLKTQPMIITIRVTD
jgi:hypothetical protein